MSDQLFEHPVEMRQRLETDLEGDFAHPQIRIQQEIFGFFDPHPRDIVREIDAGDLLEHLAKIEAAHVYRLGHLSEGKLLGLVFMDIIARAGNDGRLGVFLLDKDLVA